MKVILSNSTLVFKSKEPPKMITIDAVMLSTSGQWRKRSEQYPDIYSKYYIPADGDVIEVVPADGAKAQIKVADSIDPDVPANIKWPVNPMPSNDEILNFTVDKSSSNFAYPYLVLKIQPTNDDPANRFDVKSVKINGILVDFSY